jgi:hypothetical protein
MDPVARDAMIGPVVIRVETQQDELLSAVRALRPRHLVRLAGLWAGVDAGALDPARQGRRNAARVAVRYVTRREDRAEARLRAEAAARAVAEVMASGTTALSGPAADAAFAITDALDAIAYADQLAPIAYRELLLPWRELSVELAGLVERRAD